MLKRKKERRDDKTMKQSPWMITVIGMCIVWLIVSVVFGVTWQALVAVLFVLFIASILFNSFWLRKFSRQVQDLMPLLVQKRYGEFIAGNEQLLKGKSSPLLQAILLMNIATAYGEMGQYDTALSTLDQISPKGLAGTNLAIFHGKKAYFYFCSGRQGEALALLAQQQDLFDRYANTTAQGFAPLYQMLQAFRLCAEGAYLAAQACLVRAQERFSTVDFHGVWEIMKSRYPIPSQWMLGEEDDVSQHEDASVPDQRDQSAPSEPEATTQDTDQMQ